MKYTLKSDNTKIRSMLFFFQINSLIVCLLLYLLFFNCVIKKTKLEILLLTIESTLLLNSCKICRLNKSMKYILKPITYTSMFGNYLCKLHATLFAVIKLLYFEAFKDQIIKWNKHSRM